MLTSDQIDALQGQATTLMDSVNEYIIEDICRRIAKTGQFTRTAEYLSFRAQTLGIDFSDILKEVSRRLGISRRKINQMMREAAEEAYRSDARRMQHPVPFDQSPALQQIIQASTALADENFQNVTQTLGMVAPDGKELPLRDFYQKTMDWVFNNVSTGVMDYGTAIRRASEAFVDMGLTSVEYESGVVTSIEAAVRRNIMGGLGLMAEQVEQHAHDTMGANGWEMSAHANSAPDHEPYQGKQYSDAEWAELNGTAENPGKLHRRIGTLNCGHWASPIILGISSPMHTEEELEKLKADNAEGVTFQGKHYTGYEATQVQRRIERRARLWKRRNLAANAMGDEDAIQATSGRLQKARRDYREFSKAAGLREQPERMYVAKFGSKSALPVPRSGDIINDTVEKAVGVKQDIPIDMAKAAEGTNPNYAPGTPYAENCQRCVATYEFRRRGYDVTAKPDSVTPGALQFGNECFVDSAGKKIPFTQGLSRDSVRYELENAPDGSRYGIYVKFPANHAHVFVAEKYNGRVIYIDPQSEIFDATKYLNAGLQYYFGFFRMDNAYITTDEDMLREIMEALL